MVHVDRICRVCVLNNAVGVLRGVRRCCAHMKGMKKVVADEFTEGSGVGEINN